MVLGVCVCVRGGGGGGGSLRACLSMSVIVWASSPTDTLVTDSGVRAAQTLDAVNQHRRGFVPANALAALANRQNAGNACVRCVCAHVRVPLRTCRPVRLSPLLSLPRMSLPLCTHADSQHVRM
jgi:hypothetical protein